MLALAPLSCQFEHILLLSDGLLNNMAVKSNIIESNMETMALNGVHLGTLKSRGNPKMKQYIWSNKNAFLIIDLEKTKKGLKDAIDFLISVKKNGGVILFVGTGMAAKEATKNTAEELNMPYVTEKWLGGTLTNFPTITKQVNYLKNLESQKSSGEFEKYTKYEALKLQKKMEKLRKDLGGIVNLNKLPDAVWVSSANYDKIAVMESVKKSILVAGIVNTNSDPTILKYPIPANDIALNSVSFILNLVKDALINIKPAVVELETTNKK